jgi:hypothetical protein
MANTTFSGPVRSENGFGATTGKETAIQIPTNFIPLGIGVVVTTAAVNAVNLVDIGTDADTDGYVDGASLALNTTGWKGFLGCNGVLGMSGFAPGVAGLAGDEVELVVSGDPGGDTVIVLKIFGISGDPGGDTVIVLKIFGIDSTSDTQ